MRRATLDLDGVVVWGRPGLSVTTFQLGAVRVDLQELRVLAPAGDHTLSNLEAALLSYLHARRGTTVSREQLLVEVWGYSRRSVSRAVDNTVSRLRRKIEEDPAVPVWLLSTRGGGYRLQADPAEHRPHQGNIPSPRDSFVGRVQELDTLGDALGTHRLITLVGPGGTGKTRLAYELARRHGPRWASGTWLADLTHAKGSDDVTQAVAKAVRVPLHHEDGRHQLATAIGYRGPMLLVLDNCDQVTTEVADLVVYCLDAAPELCVLATSREPLRVRGEHRRRLDPLGLPSAPDPERVSASDAAELFAQRCRAVTPGFAVTRDNAADVAVLVELLDGLPLAIEIAAAQVEQHGLRELVDSVRGRLDALATDDRDRPDRHRSLLAALDWSWDRLPDPERRALAALTVFEGGCTLEAAAAVLDVDLQETERLTRSLVDRSLVSTKESEVTGSERLVLFVTVRAWAADKAPAADLLEAQVRHGAFFSRFGGDARMALSRANGGQRQQELAEDLDNLLAATRRSIARADAEQAPRLCEAAWSVLLRVGPPHLGVELAKAVLGISSLSLPDRGHIERIAGFAHERAGHLDVSMAHHLASLAVARGVGDRKNEAMGLSIVGVLDRRQGRLAEAEAHQRAALAIAAELEDPEVHAMAAGNLGRVLAARGQPQEGMAWVAEALALKRDLGDRRFEGVEASQLAIAHARQGRLDEARPLFEIALEVTEELADRWSEGGVLANLGQLAWHRGDPEEAVARLERAMAVHREVGDLGNETSTGAMLAQVYAEQGRVDDAYEQITAALGVARRIADGLQVASQLGWLGWIRALRGERDESERCFAEALDALGDVQSPRHGAEHHLLRGRAEHAWGEPAAARASLRQARRLADEAGMEPGSILARQIATAEAALGPGR